MCAQMLINAEAHRGCMHFIRRVGTGSRLGEKSLAAPVSVLCLAFWLDALPTELSLLAVIDSTEFSWFL